MRVWVGIDSATLTNDSGIDVDSIAATCSRCGDVTETFGTSENSILAALALLRENCSRGENNFYMEGRETPEAATGPKHKKTGKKAKKMEKFFDPMAAVAVVDDSDFI